MARIHSKPYVPPTLSAETEDQQIVRHENELESDQFAYAMTIAKQAKRWLEDICERNTFTRFEAQAVLTSYVALEGVRKLYQPAVVDLVLDVHFGSK